VLGYGAAKRVCMKTLLSPLGDSAACWRGQYPTLKLPTTNKWIGDSSRVPTQLSRDLVLANDSARNELRACARCPVCLELTTAWN
jgi:hypothetical protein